jgi:hypothetical protein
MRLRFSNRERLQHLLVHQGFEKIHNVKLTDEIDASMEEPSSYDFTAPSNSTSPSA